MVSLITKTLRNGSFLTTPISALLSATRNIRRKRSRLVPLLVLLLLAGMAAGGYAYATHRWHAAEKAVKDGRMEDAQRDVDFCLSVWPRSVPVHILAARVARLQGDLKGAEEHLSLCLKINHGPSEEIQLEFLLLRVQGGEIDNVVEELLYYVKSGSPESVLILDTLSRAYMQNRRFGQAYTVLSRWHEVAPDSPEPLRWRAWVLERMSDREGALSDYKKALEIDPTYYPVRLRLAELHLERHDSSAALPILEKLHKEYPEEAEVRARLGQCLFDQGRMKEARNLLEAVVKELPNDTSVLVTLARLDIGEDPPRYAEAEAFLHRAMELEPTDLEIQYQLIRCLNARGNSKEAFEMQKRHDRDRAMLKRAHETLKADADKTVTDPNALTEVGIIFLRANNERVAFYWLNRALQSDPNHQPALKALVEYYEKSGQPTKAAMYRQRLEPEKPATPPNKKTN